MFLSAILAMRYNKLTIFLGTIVSLYVMTVVSALVGFGITSFIPPIYTYYAAIVIMFLFGFKMFWDAYRYTLRTCIHAFPVILFYMITYELKCIFNVKTISAEESTMCYQFHSYA